MMRPLKEIGLRLPWWVGPANAMLDFIWAVFHPLAWVDLVRRRRRWRAAWIAAGHPQIDQSTPVVMIGWVGNLSCSAPGCEPRLIGNDGQGPSDTYETARALAAAAGPSIAELERRQRSEERRDAWILAGVLALSAATVLAGALSWAGVLR